MTIEIALIQRPCGSDPYQNLRLSSDAICAAAEGGAQIVCLQELFSTAYFCQTESEEAFALAETVDGPLLSQLSELAKKLGIVLIVPFFEKVSAGIYYNSAAILDVDGKRLALYRKMHIPDDSQFMEKYYFSPGENGFFATETRFGKIGVCICWDQWFPEAARLTAMAGAEVIFFPTAIGWLPEDLAAGGGMAEDQCDAWRTMQRSHAIANGCFVAAANRVGVEKSEEGREIHFWGQSFVSNPAGRIIASASSESEEILHTSLDLSEIETQRIQWPFFRDRRIDAYDGLLNRFGKG